MKISQQVSDFFVEFEATPLRKPNGDVYHVVPAERCRVGIVSRRRKGVGPDGKDIELPPETEAAFIRGGGAWVPPVFWMGYGGEIFNDTKYF